MYDNNLIDYNTKWYYPTNRLHLLSVLAGGIVGAKSMYEKYRGGLLDICGSKYLLLKNGMPDWIMQNQEFFSKTNYPVLLEIDLEKVDMSAEQDWTVLENPLPIESIKSVHFRNESEKKSFFSKLFENVPANNINHEVTPGIFGINTTDFFNTLVQECHSDDLVNENKARKAGRLADALTGVTALLSRFAQSHDDLFFLLDIYDRNSNFHDRLSPEYALISDALNDILASRTRKEADSNYFLLKNFMNHILSEEYRNGWSSREIIEILFGETIKDVITEFDKSKLEKWYRYSLQVLENRTSPTQHLFSDDRDLIKRSILLFLLRNSPEDIIESEYSFLKTGRIVRTFALIFAGIYRGYERMENRFKSKEEYMALSVYKTTLVEKLTSNKLKIPVSMNLKITCEPQKGVELAYNYILSIGNLMLGFAKYKAEQIVFNVYKILKDNNLKFEHDALQNILSYSFEFEQNRKQPVFIQFSDQYLNIYSPCFDLSRPSYMRKLTKDILLQMLTRNTETSGRYSFQLWKNKFVAISTRIHVSEIKTGENLIELLEDMAFSADEFEKNILGVDRYQ